MGPLSAVVSIRFVTKSRNLDRDILSFSPDVEFSHDESFDRRQK
jgi:hypothetical protein